MDGFVLFCFCPYPGAHWFLSSWRGGRAGVFPRRPVSPSLTSRPAARWPPRAEPRETPGARGTPGVVVHRGPRGLGRWGRRGVERQRLRRKEPNPLGFRGERLPMAQNFPGAEGRGPTRETHPGKSVEWRFSTSHHFLVDSPAELREPAVSNNDFRRFPRPSSCFEGLRFLFTVNTCLAYFA